MNRIKPSLSQALIHLTLVGAVCAPASVLAGTTAARADVTASSHSHHAQKGTDMYRTHLQMHPTPAQAGQPVTLTLTVRDGEGRAVSRLTPSHEKPMHLFVVSRDLRHFAHVHPSLAGDSFRVQHTFAAAGEYTLFVDYQQPGRGQVVDRHSVHIEGAARPMAAALTESPRTQRADGLEVTLHSDEGIRAGEAAMLHFDVTDAATGKPVVDLEPYLGAMTSTEHFVIPDDDLRSPCPDPPVQAGGRVEHAERTPQDALDWPVVECDGTRGHLVGVEFHVRCVPDMHPENPHRLECFFRALLGSWAAIWPPLSGLEV